MGTMLSCQGLGNNFSKGLVWCKRAAYGRRSLKRFIVTEALGGSGQNDASSG